MSIRKQTAARQIAAYLHHEITQAQLVEWAEHGMMEGEFAEGDMEALRGYRMALGATASIFDRLLTGAAQNAL